MKFPALCGALLALAACAPSPVAPVKVMAIVPSATGTYETHQVELTTIKNIVSLSGDVVRLQGGATIEFNSQDPLQQAAQTEEQLADAVQRNRGGDVTANLIDKAGVLWPADFQSWAMVTTYFNFEQSYRYFQNVYPGKSDELLGTRVLYWASFRNLDQSEDEQTDNAIWVAPIKAFLVLPFKDFQKVPLSVNIGLVGHEFAHLVFNKKAFGGAGLPAPLESWHKRPFNLLKSIDEGFADFHGYGVTCVSPGPGCRASFLTASLGDKAAPRDLADSTHCMTEELRGAFETFETNAFMNAGLQYKIGTLVATSLYTAALKAGDKTESLQKSLIAAYDDPSSTTPGFKQVLNVDLESQAFTPEEMTDTLASHIADLSLREAVCNELVDRLQLECSGFPCDPPPLGGVGTPLPHCPAATTRGKAGCPALPMRKQ